MKTITSTLVAVVILISLFQPVNAKTSSLASIPTFSIVSVVADTSVTIKTYNFPADQTFTVRMGAYGTLGVGGIIVTTTDSGVIRFREKHGSKLIVDAKITISDDAVG